MIFSELILIAIVFLKKLIVSRHSISQLFSFIDLRKRKIHVLPNKFIFRFLIIVGSVIHIFISIWQSGSLTDISCFWLICKFCHSIIILSLVRRLINHWSKHNFFWWSFSPILLLFLSHLILLNNISSKTKIVIFSSLRSCYRFIAKIYRGVIVFINLIFIVFIKLNVFLNILVSFL